jgi:hydroxymethylpyrimidine pyrophosphatase-like HAD family hydrolase
MRYSELLRVPIHTTPDLREHVQPGIRAVSWRCAAENRASLMQTLENALDGRAWVTASHALLVDVNPCGADKGGTLRAVQGALDLSPAETLSIGDSPNDLSLLLAAAHRAAVANAAPELKEVATYVATAPRGRGALECFDRFGLSG